MQGWHPGGSHFGERFTGGSRGFYRERWNPRFLLKINATWQRSAFRLGLVTFEHDGKRGGSAGRKRRRQRFQLNERFRPRPIKQCLRINPWIE
jgi:hypothetical protein